MTDVTIDATQPRRGTRDMSLGKRVELNVRAEAARARITLHDLAIASDIAPTTFARRMTRKCDSFTVSELERIAAVLGVHITALIN